jgi:phosphoglycerol transferase MdoB-like AlkP superfamily enzyme
VAACALGIFILTRIVLAVVSSKDISVGVIPHIFVHGAWFDLVTTGALLSPFLLVNAILPNWARRSRPFAWFSLIVIWLFVAILLFSAIGEFLFWDEFATRYNFIAVDYLVYTQEVLANIVQSYPVKTLLAALAVVAAGIIWALLPWIRSVERTHYPWSTRAVMLVLAVAGPSLALTANIDQMRGSGNAYADELSGNGLFSLVSAFFLNELDYDKFYATLLDDRAVALLAGLGVPRGASATNAVAASEIVPTIPAYLVRRPKNIVLITVESLSAEYVGAYANTSGLTPNLDRIASQGLVFDRFFAPGTRTVRGLEATSLGTPPVPGQAIVHRPKSDHLTTIGEILHHQGFQTMFAYGGNAFFDNMAAYFGGNDYDVLDQGDFPADSIVFQNAWGVADESLFSNVERKLTQDVANGKPFFAHIMTTSNHRPYSYPDGRIDIASPGGRDGAVKYTDYAIGEFLKQASAQSWFADTLFVITADHCASAAGKTELPVSGYHIPMIFYGPGMVKPGHVIQTLSQIDIPPTLLHILAVAGENHFFGQAYDGTTVHDERAFISNYQSLGYLKNDTLTILRPKKVVESFRVDSKTLASTPAPVDPNLRDEAIAFYQTASRGFKNGSLRAPW